MDHSTNMESAGQAKNRAATWSMIAGLAAAAVWWFAELGYFGAEPMLCVMIGFPLVPFAAILGLFGLFSPARKRFAIIGLLACATTIPIFLGLVDVDPSPRVTALRTQATRSQLAVLSGALRAFRADVGRYPTTAEGLEALVTPPANLPQWHGPYLDRTRTWYPNNPNQAWNEDPWSHPFVYHAPAGTGTDAFDLFSCGRDGEPGTPDDIRP